MFGLQNWLGTLSAVYFNGDSNINFYDTEAGAVSIGGLFRF
jgi:hypothetical protein